MSAPGESPESNTEREAATATNGAGTEHETPVATITRPSSTNMLDAGLELARQGLRILVVHGVRFGDGHEPSESHQTATGCGCESAKCEPKNWGKHPVGRNWQNRATSNEDALTAWYAESSRPNIGLCLGPQASGVYLIAIDVDDRKRLSVLEAELGPLPETVSMQTGRGEHRVYVAPSEIAPSRFSPRVGITSMSEEGKHPGVDARVKGGQVVLPPSQHQSGGHYGWIRDGAIAVLPVPWAHALTKETPPPPTKWRGTFTPQSVRDDARIRNRHIRWLEKAIHDETYAVAACPEGGRNDCLNRAAYSLYKAAAGVCLPFELVTDALLPAAKHAGLGEHEIRRTLESASQAVVAKGVTRVPLDRTRTNGAAIEPVAHAPADDANAINVVEGYRHLAADQAVRALVQTPGEIFVQLTNLVHAVNAEALGKDDRSPIAAGTPLVMPLPVPLLSKHLGEVLEWSKPDMRVSSGRRRIDPDQKVVTTVHQHHQWPGMRPLVGVSEVPILHLDGKVTTDGYDRRTRYLVRPSRDIRVPEHATQPEAEEALRTMLKPFAQFNFASEPMRYVVIAAAATMLLRASIDGPTPAFAFDAPEKASGKTLLARCAMLTGHGRKAGGATWPSQGDDEVEKILGGYALRGAPVVFFDNVRRGLSFGGAPIEKILTETRTTFRVLGETGQPDLEWRAVVIVTGNNLGITEDCTRRVVLARIEPPENPSKRTDFTHHPLDDWCDEHRAELVSAIFTMARAWIDAGKPPRDVKPLASFESWTDIARMIVFAGGLDVTSCVPEDDVDRHNELGSEIDFVDGLRSWLVASDGLERGTYAKDLIQALYPDGRPAKGDGRDALRDAIESLCPPQASHRGVPDSRLLGIRMSHLRGKWCAGMRLLPAADDTKSKKSKRWTVRNKDEPVGGSGGLGGSSAAGKP